MSTDDEFVSWARRAAEVFNARDLEGFLGICHAEIEAHPLLSQLAGDPFRGHDGVRAWWAETFELWEYSPLVVEEVLAAGDSGLALIRMTARGQSSGAAMELEGGLMFHLRDGLCDRFRVYVDREEARLVAAGLASG